MKTANIASRGAKRSIVSGMISGLEQNGDGIVPAATSGVYAAVASCAKLTGRANGEQSQCFIRLQILLSFPFPFRPLRQNVRAHYRGWELISISLEGFRTPAPRACGLDPSEIGRA